MQLDTNGSRPEVIAGLLEGAPVDYIAMNIKAPLEKYALLCGLPVDTGAICRSIDIIATSGMPHHFRTTFFRPLLSENDLAALKNLVPPHAKHLTQTFREPSGIFHNACFTAQAPRFSYLKRDPHGHFNRFNAFQRAKMIPKSLDPNR